MSALTNWHPDRALERWKDTFEDLGREFSSSRTRAE
jgi:hypothetical protein